MFEVLNNFSNAESATGEEEAPIGPQQEV
jgi:hypothetical protein